MTEFRAKLRKPKNEYVLGAIVAEMEPVISKSGQGYYRVKFENYPLICSLGQFFASRMRYAMDEHGLKGEILEVGEQVHLNVRWREFEGGIVYPDVQIDMRALLDSRLLRR